MFANNAAIGDWNFVRDVDIDKLLAMLDLDSRALVVLPARLARDQRETDACLITVTSLAGDALFGAAVRQTRRERV